MPENIVIDRYNMSLLYLRKEIFGFTQVYLIENSTETAEQMAIVKNGILISKKEDCSKWVNSILFFVEKLKSKK